MQASLILVAAFTLTQPDPLGAGDHKRTITVDELKRTHLVHVPPKYDAKKPIPVVLALHGAMMDGKLMEYFSGLNDTADRHHFIVVYPNGTSPVPGLFQTWNAGKFPGELNKAKADDVKYLGKVLDDVESAFTVDKKRVYAAGLSNGAMMSYRLAAEMSDRIAAIMPVAGTMAVEKYEPKQPVSVLHIHGTKDALVPYEGPNKKGTPNFLKFRSVDDTVAACVKANGCSDKKIESEVDMKADKMKVTRRTYNNGKNGSEVVLYILDDGGHVWPGSTLNPIVLGKTTDNINANELMWEFFKKHSRK
jgi:polyhydroxybutyrate depolymerase